MTYVIIAAVLLIFHYGAITQLSLIMGRYQRAGFLPKRSIAGSPFHLIGLVSLLLAGVSVAIAMRVDGMTVVGDVACAVFLAVDVIMIHRAIRSSTN